MSDKDVKSKNTRELIEHVAEICKRLGWDIAIPSTDTDKVPGMILGTEEYIESVLDGGHLEDIADDDGDTPPSDDQKH